MPISNQNYALKIGYVPLLDSAPLLVARELGYFEEEGVKVSLQEEVGWATVRDKIIHGELDMASCLLGLPYALNNGVGCYQTDMTIPLIISANGNTITLSKDIPKEALQKPAELAAALNARAAKGKRKWTFATVNPYSSHLILLFQWLNAHLKDYIREIEITFIPPQLFPDLLESGMIDGFCAGEPWGSFSEINNSGQIVADSLSLNANHPEKVLAVPKRTMEHDTEGVQGACKAILRACKDCEDPAFRKSLLKILTDNLVLDPTSHNIEQYLQESLGKEDGKWSELHTFYGAEINKPAPAKEQWVLRGLKEAGLFRKKIISTGQLMDPDCIFNS